MSQRNPMNERYSDENRKGKTRKSAASAKPSADRAATVRTPAPKTKKQKKEEARKREEKRNQQMRAMAPDARRFEDQPEYKRLRRLWWIFLVSAILLIGLSFVGMQNEAISFLNVPCIIAGYVLVIAAFYIDLGKIRKLRKKYEQTMVLGKTKEARKAQKKARAEVRAQQKEAEENTEAVQTEEAEKKEGGILSRFRKKPEEAPAEATEEKLATESE